MVLAHLARGVLAFRSTIMATKTNGKAVLPAKGLPTSRAGWKAYQALPDEEKIRRLDEENEALGFTPEEREDRTRFARALIEIIMHDAICSGDVRRALRPDGMEDTHEDTFAKTVERVMFEWDENGLNRRKKFKLSDLEYVRHLLY
jgi:hypothetical protein